MALGKCVICKIIALLAGIGALNWGLVALLDMNLVTMIAGEGMISTVIYGAVGIAGLLLLVMFVKPCPCGNK